MPLSVIDRSSKQNINKETRELNDTLDKIDLIGHRKVIEHSTYPKTTEYSFFLRPHGTFSRIDHILGQKKAQLIPKD